MTTLKNIITNNGATLDANGNAITYKNGYQVSIKDIAIIKLYKLRKSHIIELLNNNYNLGVWIENKNVYLDYSIRIANKKDAIKTGKANNQISIYNWKNGDCIYLKK